MKNIFIAAIASASIALISSCSSIDTLDTVDNHLRELKWTPYTPPQGNPSQERDWVYYGPGTILRSKSHDLDYVANAVIGSDYVQQARETKLKYSMPKTSTNKTYLVKAGAVSDLPMVGAFEAELSASGITDVAIEFGPTYRSVAAGTGQMKSILRNSQNIKKDADVQINLKNGASHFLTEVLYTNSLTVTFYKKNVKGGLVKANIPQTVNSKIDGTATTVKKSSLTINEPVFLGYRFLNRNDLDSVFN